MKILTAILTLFFGSLALASNDIIIECATGIASQHLPLTSKWGGPVLGDGTYFREQAVRASYDLNEHIGVSLMSGWLDKWNFRDRNISYIPPPEGFPPSTLRHDQQVIYLVPTIRLTAALFKISLGGIAYDSDTENRAYLQYPFNGSHRFKPSFMAAIGEEDVYLYVSYLNSLPLYSGGGAEAGIFGRVGGYYEQKAYVGGAQYGLGIGYRGEFKVLPNAALALGFSLGHNADVGENFYGVTAGLKVRISGKK